jgi:hypothetical protein
LRIHARFQIASEMYLCTGTMTFLM